MNEEVGTSVPFVEDDTTKQSTDKTGLSQPTVGSVVEQSSKTSKGTPLQTEGHWMDTYETGSIDCDRVGSGGDVTSNFEDKILLTSESNIKTATRNLLSRRLPVGYHTPEEAEEALVILLGSQSPSETNNPIEAKPRSDRRVFETAQEKLFSGAYSTRFLPDTSIAEVYDDLIRQAKRLRNPLNDLHMLLLERQAEILQLRMTTVSSLMEFKSIISSIQDRIRSPPSSADHVSEAATADSVGNDQPVDSKLHITDRRYRLDYHPTLSRRRGRSNSFDRIDHALSMSMHTIHEESSNENGESSGRTTEPSQESQSFGSSSSEDESSSPPHDRWCEVSLQNSLVETSPRMHIRRRQDRRLGDLDATNYDWLLLELQRTSDLSGETRRLTRWQSFPQWKPVTMTKDRRRSRSYSEAYKGNSLRTTT